MSLLPLLLIPQILVLASSDVLPACQDPSVCRHGGTCQLMNPHVSAHSAVRCSEEEHFFDGHCYEPVREALPWRDADERCRNKGARLVQINDERTRLSISSILSGNVQKHSRAFKEIGFWTGAQMTRPGAGFRWMPEGEPVSQSYWEANMEIRAPADRQCVSLHGSSSFRDWHIESCDSMNFFVCQRLETTSTEVNFWSVQCQCSEGFFGRYCEIPTNITEQGVSPESYACADEVFLYSCPSGSTIVVDYALYGHIEGEENKGSCIAEDDSTSLCEGLTFCQFNHVRDMFYQNPCPSHVPISLRYRMRCSEEPRNSCGDGSVYVQGRCYTAYGVSEQKGYVSAWKHCLDQGGDVADARSDVVYPMVFSALLARNFTDAANFWIKSAQLEAKMRSRDAVTNFTGEGMECLSVSMHSQETRPEPCQLQLGWICEFPPTEHVDVRLRQIMETPKKATSTQSGMDGPPLQPTATTIPAAIPRKPHDSNLLACEETVQQGYALPLTRACESVDLPCNGRNMAGVARWTCGCSNGEWSRHPEGCRHRWMAQLENDFNSTTGNNRDARQISERLADALRTALREGEFSGGDIVGCIWLSKEVLSIAGEQVRRMTRFDEKRNFSLNFAEIFGSAGDQLLSEAAMEAWLSLPDDERVKQAAALMQALQKSMMILSEGIPIGEHAQLDFDHWTSKMEVKQLIPQNKMQASPPRGVQASRTSTFTGPGASSFSPVQDVQFAGRAKAPTMQLPSDDLLRYSAMNSYFGVFAHAIAPLADAPATENKLKVGTFMYTSLENLLQTEPTRIVNSHIVGAFVNDPSTSMNISQQPASFTFYHLRKLGVSNPTCVYWKVADNKWDDTGCLLVETNDEFTKCSCNHLTSFAILMDFYGDVEESLSPINSAILEAITVFGCSLSAACLFVSVVVFTAYRSLYNTRNTIHRHVCIALFFSNVLFVLGLALKGTSSCSVIAVLLHFFLFSAFMWMLLEGCHLYMMLVQVFEASHKRLILYYLVGYGIPFVTVLTSLLLGEGHKNYGTLDACWINTRSATKWAFIIPVTVVVSLNTIVLFIALRVVMSVRRERTNAERISGWLKGSAMLLCLLGTTWIFGYLVNIPDSSTRMVFSYIFTVLNTLQGLFIFILHVLMNDKVRNTALRSLRKGVCCSEDPLSSFSSRGQLFSRKSFLVRLWKFRESSSATGNTTGSTEAKRLSNEGKNASAQARELEKKLAPKASEEDSDSEMPSPPSDSTVPLSSSVAIRRPQLTSYEEWKKRFAGRDSQNEINIPTPEKETKPHIAASNRIVYSEEEASECEMDEYGTEAESPASLPSTRARRMRTLTTADSVDSSASQDKILVARF